MNRHTATIRSINARAVSVPFNLKPITASGALSHATLVLMDMQTSEDVVGRAYLFGFSPAIVKPLVATIDALSGNLIGDALCPLDLDAKLRKSLRLLDTPGLVGLALSGLDMCAWDAHAKLLNQPLARVLGSGKTEIQAYNSCGLWIQDPDKIGDEAISLLQSHDFTAVKMRAGRVDPADDLRAAQNVRKAIGDSANLMLDFNQSQTVRSAITRSQLLESEGLSWIEEPIRHNDFKGTSAIRQSVNTPIQTGENICTSFELLDAINDNAADYYMPDVQRIGGVTGWQRAAAVCHAAEIEMSSHLFPEFSVHLLAATPTCHWLEYVDWASPILEEPIEIKNGMAQVPDRPGAGISWDEKAVAKYLV